MKYFPKVSPNAQARRVKCKILYFDNIENARNQIASKVFENEISELEIYNMLGINNKFFNGSASAKIVDEDNFFDINNASGHFYENGYAEIQLSTTEYRGSDCFVTVKISQVKQIDIDGIYKNLKMEDFGRSDVDYYIKKYIYGRNREGTAREIVESQFASGFSFRNYVLRVIIDDAMNLSHTFTAEEMNQQGTNFAGEQVFNYMCQKFNEQGFNNVQYNIHQFGVTFTETWENDTRYQIDGSDIISVKMGTTYIDKQALSVITVTNRGNILYDYGDILSLQFKGQTYRFKITALRYTMKNGSLTGEIEGSMITT